MPDHYTPQRLPRSQFITLRGLRYHCQMWGDASLVDATRPPLVMLHGWMDVGASFQFVVDSLAHVEGFERWVIAPDWRGFGLSDSSGDCYWFPDYLGDLDALVDALQLPRPFDLVGHSMGGNVVMSYAGIRPDSIRRLVNLEGFGMPATRAVQAPKRLHQWLEELKAPQQLRSYTSLAAVADRLRQNNPRLDLARANWLAEHWARQGDDGRWHILGDPAHKRVNPMLYRVDEILETWKLITAPLLWVEAAQTDIAKWWGQRYTVAEFHDRLGSVSQVQRSRLEDCGHMLHHDQPEALAKLLAGFLEAA